MGRVITLLTDFGQVDTYVGQVKGAVLRVAGEAQLVGLTHEVPAQDVRVGAFLLWTAVEAFSPGTVHLAVVDPGVGSGRRAIAAEAVRGDLFVGPDNGLLGPAIDRLGGLTTAVELTNPAFWAPEPSPTFHGRDIFGPVAAHIASGVPLHNLGRTLDRIERPFSFPSPVRTGDLLRGEVLHVDTFGNLVTNIEASLLTERFTVRIGAHTIEGLSHHYQEVAPGALLALVGSAGLLEVSARNASAASATDAKRGDRIEVAAA